MSTLTIDPLAIYSNAVTAANEIGRKIQAANSDRTDAVKSVLDTSDDAKIVKFREGRAALLEQIETIQAKITNGEAMIKEYAEKLVPGVDADFDKDAETKKFIAARKTANDARKALLNFVSEEDLAAAEKELGIVPIVSLRGTGKAGSSGGATGVKRPRISAATMNGTSVWKKGSDDSKVDFTSLAVAAKSDADTLKNAAFEAAGTKDLNSLEAGSTVSFTVGENNFVVTISGEKPGRKPAEVVAE